MTTEPKPTWTIDGETFTRGQNVSVIIRFPNGSTRRMSGELIAVKDLEAYIETSFGPMAGSVLSMESEE